MKRIKEILKQILIGFKKAEELKEYHFIGKI